MFAVSAGDVTRGLFGTALLARLDPRGIEVLDRTPEGAAKSFSAAVVILPAFLVLMLIRDGAALEETNVLRFALIEAIAYVISWTAFPVLMVWIVGLILRQERYFDFLVAYNWAQCWQMAVFLPIVVLGAWGVVPDMPMQLISMVAMMLVLGYAWYVLKTALDVGGLMAAGLLSVDFAVTLLIADITEVLLRAG